ncbi:MAG: ABC transporter ATP-binding protein [Muribaculaceae bacterium]|nr:ABC transporter ATP-binding protein [Muribaculaceae bacterium]
MFTLLKAKNVTKIYPKAQHKSLDNVSFDVAEREFIAIMGASGSGKTTLLNVLSTIDTPTSGNITINGVNLKALNDSGAANFRRDYLGFIFQEYLLLDSLTIFENIAVPLTLQKLPPWKIENMIQSLAKTFGIDSQLSKYPGELSGGQRQRACALRAIVKRPSILFADEPTGALDSASATDLLKTLKKSNENLGTTILMVTHDIYAASFANRILIFKDGRIIQELLKQDNDRRTFYESIAQEVAKLDTER